MRNAELAGASAAIVYDDVYEALIIMSKPRGNPDPLIPSVFVSEKAGIIMKKLLTPGQTRVRIMPVRLQHDAFTGSAQNMVVADINCALEPCCVV